MSTCRKECDVADYASLALAITATGGAASSIIIAVDKYRHGSDEDRADRLERKAAKLRHEPRDHGADDTTMHWAVVTS